MAWLKDPEAVLDYAFDWTAWLADGETVTSHSLTTTAGVTVDSTSAAAGVVTVWLSGGTDGGRYELTCRVVTSQGRTDERTQVLQVKHR